MKNYYEKVGLTFTDYMPQTFHIKIGLEDPEYTKFE